MSIEIDRWGLMRKCWKNKSLILRPSKKKAQDFENFSKANFHKRNENWKESVKKFPNLKKNFTEESRRVWNCGSGKAAADNVTRTIFR